MQARICCFVSWRAPANTFYFLSGWQTVKIRGAQSDFGMLVSSRCVWVCVVKNALCFQGQCFFRPFQHVWNDARELAQTCTARAWLDRPDSHDNLIWDIQIPGMTDAAGQLHTFFVLPITHINHKRIWMAFIQVQSDTERCLSPVPF